jgi:hypothetical protein
VELIASRHCAHCVWSRQRATPPHPANAVVVVVVPVVEVVVVAEVKFAAATGWVTVAVATASDLTLVLVAVVSAACRPTAAVPASWSVAPHEWRPMSHTVVTTAHMNKWHNTLWPRLAPAPQRSPRNRIMGMCLAWWGSDYGRVANRFQLHCSLGDWQASKGPRSLTGVCSFVPWSCGCCYRVCLVHEGRVYQ